ncbi:MAG: substrate-binding domain-containing protein [Verrucomicrobiota bacterium]
MKSHTLSFLSLIAVFTISACSSEDQKSTAAAKELRVYCAAGLKRPLEELAGKYEREFGTEIHLQFGGSGTLLATIESTKQGDLYLPADSTYAVKARDKQLCGEAVPLAVMHPVLAVQQGNPKKIAGWNDLLERRELILGLCHPEAAAIGKIIRDIAQKHGDWQALDAAKDVSKSTVSELALDLKAGALDAALLWDQTVASTSGLGSIPCPELAGESSVVPGTVLVFSKNQQAATHFLTWISSPETSAPVFQKHHFSPVKPH